MDVSKMKVAEIKKELKDRGLNQAGNKQELVTRLQEAIEAEVIGQDDDVVDDLNESESVEVNAKEEEEVLEPKPEEAKPVKKIVLNRQNHIEIEAPKDDPATDATTAGADEKKTDGAPVVSSAERLALRAKRFGSAALEPAAPAATPAKTTVPITAAPATTDAAPPAKKSKVEMSAEQLEVLRKRAERFGTISPAIESIEMADKKKQRLDRFITSAATADATPAVTPVVEATPLTGPAAVVSGDIKTMSVEERKKLRAERFK